MHAPTLEAHVRQINSKINTDDKFERFDTYKLKNKCNRDASKMYTQIMITYAGKIFTYIRKGTQTLTVEITCKTATDSYVQNKQHAKNQSMIIHRKY